MASGSASYSTNATNYGRNSADAYYYLSAPDTINGPLTVTGNLVVDGSTTLTGPVTAGSTLAVAGNETVGGNLAVTGNETVGGTLTTAGAFQVNAASVLNGNASVTGSLNVTGAATLAGGLTVTGNAQVGSVNSILSFPAGNVLLSTADGSLPAGTLALSSVTNGAGLVTNVPLSVPSIKPGSLGATFPVVPTLFGTSGVSSQWNNTGGGVEQATFVIAGYRVIFGTSAFAGNNSATTVNFTTPFAATCMPLVFLQSMTAGANPPISGLVAICQSGGGTGTSPTHTGFQAQAVQAGGSTFPASFCWIAIGAA